jgi:hypothetical protein
MQKKHRKINSFVCAAIKMNTHPSSIFSGPVNWRRSPQPILKESEAFSSSVFLSFLPVLVTRFAFVFLSFLLFFSSCFALLCGMSGVHWNGRTNQYYYI